MVQHSLFLDNLYSSQGQICFMVMSLFHIIIQQTRLINSLSSTQAFKKFPKALTPSWWGGGEVGGNGDSNGPNLGVACPTSIYILSAQLELSPISLFSQLQRLAKIVQLCAQERSKISFITVSQSLSLYLFQQLKVTPRGKLQSITSKLAEEKKGSQKFFFFLDHRNFYSLNRKQERGKKASRKEDGKQKIQSKTGEITPKISVITININIVTRQLKQSRTTQFLQGKFLKQTHT